MGKQYRIKVVTQFLCLLTDQELQLVRVTMMEMDLTLVMFVFMIIMDLLGSKLEQILTEKQQVIIVAGQFLYLLTDQELLSEHLLMMEVEPISVMSVFISTIIIVGLS